jgi:hypothetical protein
MGSSGLVHVPSLSLLVGDHATISSGGRDDGDYSLVRIMESGKLVWVASNSGGVSAGEFVEAGSEGVLSGRADETNAFIAFETLSGEYSFVAEWEQQR